MVLKLQSGTTREFNGIVCRFASTGSSGKLNYYQAIVRPWDWLLTRSTDCDIFKDKTVVEIVTDICQKSVYGGHAKISTALLGNAYPKLEYCVQYRETDINFICRLMEQAGIYFFFQQKNRPPNKLAPPTLRYIQCHNRNTATCWYHNPPQKLPIRNQIM